MTLQDAWQKWTTFYAWLGGHPMAAGLIVGLIAGFTLGKVL